MIRFAADEDFNNDVVRALRRALPEVNILGVREAGRGGQPDPEVLAWAAAEARVLLTHDVTTMTRHALDRVARGERVGNLSGGGARWQSPLLPSQDPVSPP